MPLAVLVLMFLALPEPPLGLPLFMPVPDQNPLTPEKVAFGRKLFFDKSLSRDRSISCATCHDPERAFSDDRKLARGINNAEGPRNSPALINRGYGNSFFWDGRAATLEQQVLEPIANPKEMDLSIASLRERTAMEPKDVAAALASYVRTIRSGESRFDRYSAGDSSALTKTEIAGLNLFRGKANCVACHVGPNFTDEQFHNTGIPGDEGRFKITGNPDHRGAFKTPTLREIARSAPYMHDGSIPTLEAVIDHYSEGGRANPQLDPEIRPLRLTDAEKSALVAFLRTLSGQIREGWR
jgi:cytochrome c peroxidase